jgi:transketolase
MKRHESMRGWFAYELYQQMKKNKNIWLIVGDLGYKIYDTIQDEMPDRFINTGAAEQAMMGIGVGLALEGKIPFIYSITPFLLYRPFETIRNYINKEKIAVKLVGGGRNKDYNNDGFSHWAEENKQVISLFPNINSYWPEKKEEIPELVNLLINNGKPTYINLKR